MINLRFDTTELVSPRYAYHPLTIIRLLADVRFVRADGHLSESREAIVDTGAHTSVLPLTLWQRFAVEIDEKDVTLGGINDQPECQIPASLGKARCFLTDETGRLSPELDISCFLAKTDRVPLILGFANLLSQFKICFDYENKEAFALPTSAG